MQIRDAEPDDADAVVALMRELAEHEGLAEYFLLTPSALLTNAFQPPPRFHLIVATSGADIIGYATYLWQFSPWAGREYLLLDDLYVSASHRGAGAGLQLMSRIAEIALARDVDARWHVEMSNRAAQQFYTRLGAALREKMIAYWMPAAMRAFLAPPS